MKIGIIGVGFVGKATAKVLEGAHEILLYDKYKEEYKNPNGLRGAEVVFICVPTPAKQDGEIDLSIIYDSLETLKSINNNRPTIVIRSTAVPGTCETLSRKYDFNFASNPEFLREKHALEDMANPPEQEHSLKILQ